MTSIKKTSRIFLKNEVITMQNLGNITKDIYDEIGTYQIAFYVNEKTKEINHPESFTKAQKENIETQIILLEKLEAQLQSFEFGKTAKMIEKNITFAKFLIELNQEFSLSRFTRSTRNKIMEFFTKTLDLLLHLHYKEEFIEIATILFENNLEKTLQYNAKQEYLDIEQDKLGLVRSAFYYQLSLERAQELKRMRNH